MQGDLEALQENLHSLAMALGSLNLVPAAH
jgi:hypothetical protein